jgi:hypothetical protein
MGPGYIALLAGGTWLFLLWAWWASLASTKNVWTAGAATVTSYLDLSIERCRRNIAGIGTINRLVLFETLFGLVIGNKIVADIGRWKASSFVIRRRQCLGQRSTAFSKAIKQQMTLRRH